jgi:hypothetical protein
MPMGLRKRSVMEENGGSHASRWGSTRGKSRVLRQLSIDLNARDGARSPGAPIQVEFDTRQPGAISTSSSTVHHHADDDLYLCPGGPIYLSCCGTATGYHLPCSMAHGRTWHGGTKYTKVLKNRSLGDGV